jgi:hypothetical protein
VPELIGEVVGWLLVTGIAIVTGWTARRVMRSVNRAPAPHALIRVDEAGMVALAVRGVIAGPASARSLLTGAPCALATTSVAATDDHQNGPHPLWQQTSVGDLLVRYDREIRIRPKRITERPGTLPVRADQIVVDRPVGRTTRFPVDDATLDRLCAVGLPAALRGRIAADPGRFTVDEHVLMPGEVIHLAAEPTPDPRAEPRFHLSPGGQGFMAAGLGILTWLLLPVLLFGLLCAGAVAYILITEG